MNKVIIVLILLAVVSLLLFGCGITRDAGDSGSTENSEQPQTPSADAEQMVTDAFVEDGEENLGEMI